MDLRRFAVIALVIVILFSIVVLIGMSQNSPIVIITSMLATTIAVATPLTLGALSGIYCERAGVVHFVLLREARAKLRLRDELATLYGADQCVHVQRASDHHRPCAKTLLPLRRHTHDFRKFYVGLFELYTPARA